MESLQTVTGRPRDEHLKEAVLLVMLELRRANTSTVQAKLAERGANRPSWNTVAAKLEELAGEGSLRRVELGRLKHKRSYYYEIL